VEGTTKVYLEEPQGLWGWEEVTSQTNATFGGFFSY